MKFASLGSGSRGNGTVVQAGDSYLLVDCGFSLRETENRLRRLGVEPSQLNAILVTHEHTDHCAGVGKLSRRYDLPVYTSHGTWVSGRCGEVHELVEIRSERGFRVGDVHVMPVAVPHDAREPCQFVFRFQGLKLGILTDLGSITPLVIEHYADCDALLLECNHDHLMLRNGPYPPALQRRVGGEWGHLNNRQAAQLLEALRGPRLRQVVIAHISEQNNDQSLYGYNTAKAYLSAYKTCDHYNNSTIPKITFLHIIFYVAR